jgi:hypothetical protein
MSLLGAGCTRCGQPYAAPGIRVLAQREEIAFVQLVCSACQTQTMALVTGTPATGDDPSGLGESVLGDQAAFDSDDLDESRGRQGPPISEAEVLEMRAYLSEYEGDVRGLFNLPGDGDESGGDATDAETGAAD